MSKESVFFEHPTNPKKSTRPAKTGRLSNLCDLNGCLADLFGYDELTTLAATEPAHELSSLKGFVKKSYEVGLTKIYRLPIRAISVAFIDGFVLALLGGGGLLNKYSINGDLVGQIPLPDIPNFSPTHLAMANRRIILAEGSWGSITIALIELDGSLVRSWKYEEGLPHAYQSVSRYINSLSVDDNIIRVNGLNMISYFKMNGTCISTVQVKVTCSVSVGPQDFEVLQSGQRFYGGPQIVIDSQHENATTLHYNKRGVLFMGLECLGCLGYKGRIDTYLIGAPTTCLDHLSLEEAPISTASYGDYNLVCCPESITVICLGPNLLF